MFELGLVGLGAGGAEHGCAVAGSLGGLFGSVVGVKEDDLFARAVEDEPDCAFELGVGDSFSE